jgi:hypothetical protein
MALWTPIPEIDADPRHRLGRHIHRPDDFEARLNTVVPAKAGVQVSKTYTRHTSPFDQGNVGSCTGNATAGALDTDPFWHTGINYLEPDALKFYSLATHYNPPPPQWYPPNDTGSSGPAVAQAVEALGLISGFGHTTTLNDSINSLQVVPGIFGINWMTSFDNPLSTGECPLTPGAQVRGGHEIQSFELDMTNERLWFYQSWGATWGGLGNGTFWLSFATLTSLFNEGADGTFFVPLNTPGPTPAPAPAPAQSKGICQRIKGWLS